MKKLSPIILLILLSFSLFACKSENDTINTTEKSSETEYVTLENTTDNITEAPEPITDEDNTNDYSDLTYVPSESDLRRADEMTKAPLYTGAFNEFPSSTELPEGVKSIKLADGFTDNIDTSNVFIHSDIIYDSRDGEDLVLQILLPDETSEGQFPLIVYIPGSAWMRQNVYMALPSMTYVSAKGYAVAIVQYRGTDVAYFPVQIEDAKTAVRFMRKNADKYNINPDKIAIWGDSSGGHTATMAGITGNEELDNMTYGKYSSEVNCIVDWYGPTDISLMSYYQSMIDHTSPDSPEGRLIGGLNVLENVELAQKTNPLNYITQEKEIPPILIMHGSRDSLVPFNQSVRLYEKLKEFNKPVEMYKLEDGAHGAGGFAGSEALNLVLEFIERQLQ